MAVFSVLALACDAVLALLIYKYIIYPLYRSPMAKIPNAHPTAPISPAWILWTRYHHHENRNVHAAHEKHGPIVRLGPNEISVNCVDGGIRTVYSGGFEKTDWYNIFNNFGAPNMFATLQSKPHSVRKRMISNIYSKSYLSSSPSLSAISSKLLYDRFFPFISEAIAADTPIEVHDLFNGTTMDFVTGFIFGLSCSANFLQNKVERRWWLDLYQSRRQYTFWGQELPGLTKWSRKIGMPLVPSWVDEANRSIENWTIEMCDRAEQVVTSEVPNTDLSKEPVVYGQLRAAMNKSSDKKGVVKTPAQIARQRIEIASELLDQLAAGHETAAITLTYLAWELSRNPSIQASLRKELLSLDTTVQLTAAPLPSYKVLDGLPFLNAIIMETLRLHPAIPGAQPRVTPYPSANSPPTTLGPYTNIPGGVRVNAQAYSLHRAEDIFPEPMSWRPERWLDDESKPETADQKKERWFWAFGSGGRMCVGSNFALLEMKMILAAIYSNFETIIVNDEGIEQQDGYTCGPVRNKLDLRFKKLM